MPLDFCRQQEYLRLIQQADRQAESESQVVPYSVAPVRPEHHILSKPAVVVVPDSQPAVDNLAADNLAAHNPEPLAEDIPDSLAAADILVRPSAADNLEGSRPAAADNLEGSRAPAADTPEAAGSPEEPGNPAADNPVDSQAAPVADSRDTAAEAVDNRAADWDIRRRDVGDNFAAAVAVAVAVAGSPADSGIQQIVAADIDLDWDRSPTGPAVEMSFRIHQIESSAAAAIDSPDPALPAAAWDSLVADIAANYAAALWSIVPGNIGPQATARSAWAVRLV